jgi:hypothetical protein
MLAILWIFAGVGCVAFLSISAWHASPATQTFESLQTQLRKVDLAAFQNLSHPANQQFLQRRLSTSAFRTVQLLRIRAMMSYLLAVGHNAAIFIRIGEMAKHSPDKQVAETGQHLVDTALQTRILVLRIYPRLFAMWLLPRLASADFGPIISRYSLLTSELVQLLRLQRPENTVEACSALF